MRLVYLVRNLSNFRNFLYIFSMSFCAVTPAFGVGKTPQSVVSGAEDHLHNSSSVAAVVGQDTITMSDLMARVRFAKSLLRGQGEELERELMQTVLKLLIEEALQRQVATRDGCVASMSDVNQAVGHMRKANGLTEDDFGKWLKKGGISKSDFEKMVQSQLSWMHYIRRKHANSFQISQKQIDSFIGKWMQRQHRPQYHIAEIVLYGTDSQSMKSAHRRADIIMSLLRKGARFPDVVGLFSEAASRIAGGDLGWVSLDDLRDQELVEPLSRASIGQFLGPIKTSRGFSIVFLIAKRGPITGQESALPPSEQVRALLESQCLERLSFQELAKLKRETFIDIRLK